MKKENSSYRNRLVGLVAGLVLLCTALPGAFAQQDREQHVTIALTSVRYLLSLNVLANSGTDISIKWDAALCGPNSTVLDLNKVKFPAIISLSLTDKTVGDALQAILNKANTPLTYLRTGGVYTIILDPSRKPTKPMPEEAPLSGANSFSIAAPFDIAIDMLFHLYGLQYTIQPDVPIIRERVNISIHNARIDVGLGALLSSVSNAKTTLTYHYENGKYVISLAGAPPNPQATNPGSGADVEFSAAPLEDAMRITFHHYKSNYIYGGSLTGSQPVTLSRHFDSEEPAVVTILRMAQPQPMLMYRKEGDLVSLITSDGFAHGVGPAPKDITIHCSNLDFMVAAKAIMGMFRKNFSIDNTYQHIMVSLSLDHASFDEAFKALCKVLPPNSVLFHDNSYDFIK